ncbi:MAG: hypothetical protein Q9201_007582 [Fulgogasparrea decipioides]
MPPPRQGVMPPSGEDIELSGTYNTHIDETLCQMPYVQGNLSNVFDTQRDVLTRREYFLGSVFPEQQEHPIEIPVEARIEFAKIFERNSSSLDPNVSTTIAPSRALNSHAPVLPVPDLNNIGAFLPDLGLPGGTYLDQASVDFWNRVVEQPLVPEPQVALVDTPVDHAELQQQVGATLASTYPLHNIGLQSVTAKDHREPHLGFTRQEYQWIHSAKPIEKNESQQHAAVASQALRWVNYEDCNNALGYDDIFDFDSYYTGQSMYESTKGQIATAETIAPGASNAGHSTETQRGLLQTSNNVPLGVLDGVDPGYRLNVGPITGSTNGYDPRFSTIDLTDLDAPYDFEDPVDYGTNQLIDGNNSSGLAKATSTEAAATSMADIGHPTASAAPQISITEHASESAHRTQSVDAVVLPEPTSASQETLAHPIRVQALALHHMFGTPAFDHPSFGTDTPWMRDPTRCSVHALDDEDKAQLTSNPATPSSDPKTLKQQSSPVGNNNREDASDFFGNVGSPNAGASNSAQTQISTPKAVSSSYNPPGTPAGNLNTGFKAGSADINTQTQISPTNVQFPSYNPPNNVFGSLNTGHGVGPVCNFETQVQAPNAPSSSHNPQGTLIGNVNNGFNTGHDHSTLAQAKTLNAGMNFATHFVSYPQSNQRCNISNGNEPGAVNNTGTQATAPNAPFSPYNLPSSSSGGELNTGLSAGPTIIPPSAGNFDNHQPLVFGHGPQYQPPMLSQPQNQQPLVSPTSTNFGHGPHRQPPMLPQQPTHSSPSTMQPQAPPPSSSPDVFRAVDPLAEDPFMGRPVLHKPQPLRPQVVRPQAVRPQPDENGHVPWPMTDGSSPTPAAPAPRHTEARPFGTPPRRQGYPYQQRSGPGRKKPMASPLAPKFAGVTKRTAANDDAATRCGGEKTAKKARKKYTLQPKQSKGQ